MATSAIAGVAGGGAMGVEGAVEQRAAPPRPARSRLGVVAELGQPAPGLAANGSKARIAVAGQASAATVDGSPGIGIARARAARAAGGAEAAAPVDADHQHPLGGSRPQVAAVLLSPTCRRARAGRTGGAGSAAGLPATRRGGRPTAAVARACGPSAAGSRRVGGPMGRRPVGFWISPRRSIRRCHCSGFRIWPSCLIELPAPWRGV